MLLRSINRAWLRVMSSFPSQSLPITHDRQCRLDPFSKCFTLFPQTVLSFLAAFDDYSENACKFLKCFSPCFSSQGREPAVRTGAYTFKINESTVEKKHLSCGCEETVLRLQGEYCHIHLNDFQNLCYHSTSLVKLLDMCSRLSVKFCNLGVIYSYN